MCAGSGSRAIATLSFGARRTAIPKSQLVHPRVPPLPDAALALVEDKPWLGHGGGTYYTAFPPYKQAGSPWHWDHAHNDYVQVAADMGLVGLALWLGIAVVSAWQALRLVRQRRSAEALGLGVAALLATISLGLHTMVDFNLHIVANALTFTVLLAAVWAVPAAPVAEQQHRRRRRRSSSTSS